jgi:hypothetical protein
LPIAAFSAAGTGDPNESKLTAAKLVVFFITINYT